jgi:hypothetical protein
MAATSHRAAGDLGKRNERAVLSMASCRKPELGGVLLLLKAYVRSNAPRLQSRFAVHRCAFRDETCQAEEEGAE